ISTQQQQQQQEQPPKPKPVVLKPISNIATFAFGGLAGMGATCFVQPFDVVKNRLQVSGAGGNSFNALASILKTEGIAGIYSGLSAGLLRQATYTTTRLGVYNSISERMVAQHNGAALPFVYKLGVGMFAGGVGSMVGVPAEIALIRMSTDGRLPVEKRRGYKNAFDAIARISREEGVLTLWRGATPTVIRACVLNATQLASYSQAKEMLQTYMSMRDGIPLHTGASLISGLLSTIVSMPIDIAKTRLQNMHDKEYSGVLDVWRKTVRKEGVLALWRGFTPYYLRLGPHTVVTFILLEQLNKLYRSVF
ncbi:solute carrier family 25, partial [Capsaspora owczarzaki ATCC 30864]